MRILVIVDSLMSGTLKGSGIETFFIGVVIHLNLLIKIKVDVLVLGFMIHNES